MKVFSYSAVFELKDGTRIEIPKPEGEEWSKVESCIYDRSVKYYCEDILELLSVKDNHEEVGIRVKNDLLMFSDLSGMMAVRNHGHELLKDRAKIKSAIKWSKELTMIREKEGD